MHDAARNDFDDRLARIVDALPEPYATHLASLTLRVEDAPAPALLLELGMAPDEPLLGLHEGVPYTEASVELSGVLPPQITLFRQPIIDTAAELRDPLDTQIRITLLHELGHQFGLDEDDLDDLGFA